MWKLELLRTMYRDYAKITELRSISGELYEVFVPKEVINMPSEYKEQINKLQHHIPNYDGYKVVYFRLDFTRISFVVMCFKNWNEWYIALPMILFLDEYDKKEAYKYDEIYAENFGKTSMINLKWTNKKFS